MVIFSYFTVVARKTELKRIFLSMRVSKICYFHVSYLNDLTRLLQFFFVTDS